MTCDACGQDVQIGEWPWCPHGHGSYTNIPDEIPGGQWQENGFDTPRKFYSKRERDRALAARGLEIAPRHTPGAKNGLSRWL